MGRLDDIIERNKNPKTSFRKSKGGAVAPASEGDKPAEGADDAKAGRNRTPKASYSKSPAPARSTTTAVNQGTANEKGRLDRIVQRNRKPDGGYRWLKVGLAGMVLFVVLILLIFTDLAAPPKAAYPEAPAAKPTGVDGVKLWKAPKKSGSSARP